MKPLNIIRCISLIVIVLYSTLLHGSSGVITKHSTNILTDSIHTPYIQFGSGGGFTGRSTDYILTRDGRLYAHTETLEGKNTDVFIKKISSCKTNKIFRYIDKKQVMNIILDDPGNTYSYITIKKTEVHTLTWNTTTILPKIVHDLNLSLHSLL